MVTGSAEANLATERIQPRPGPGEAILVGSSSINQAFGELIARELTDRGYLVSRTGIASAGLARPDFRDMNEVIEALPISEKTAAVLVYLGVNDGQALWLRPKERDATRRRYLPWSDPRWSTVYARRAHEFYEQICKRGAGRVIALLPVDVDLPRLQGRLARVRKLQMQAASRASCAVAVATAGDASHFDDQGIARRLPDGFHMSHEGAEIVWNRIRTQTLRLVEVQPERNDPPQLGCVAPHDGYPFCRSPQSFR